MGGQQGGNQQIAQTGQPFSPPQQTPPQSAQPEEPDYFQLLMDDLYQRMKARSAKDYPANIGWEDEYESEGQGFSM